MKKLILKLKYFIAKIKGNRGYSGRVSNETKVDAPKADEKPPVVVIPDQPATIGHNLMFYPRAEIIKGMRSAGVYEHGYPVGAVIHFTAGRDENEQAAIDSLSWGAGQGYAFFVIGPSGQVYQSLPLNQWNSHCGQSYWPGLGTKLSNKLVGIEIANAGLLDNNNKAWFGKVYSPDQVRTVTKAEYGVSGKFKKYTQAQEIALFELLKWLHDNNPEVFKYDYVIGHHECSPDRKTDPGGSLSINMKTLRAALKQNKNPFI
jgi:hypothetical protein